MDLSLLLTLALIHAVALVSPGPDFAIMVKIATQQSRSAAVAAAVGISVAIVAHTILSLTGVSLVIKSSHTLYLLVQIIGACYLAWMGWGALRAAFAVLATPKGSQGVNDSGMAGSAVTPVPLGTTMSPKQGFLTGFYTNLLNPKALVFFLTLFSALITPSVTVSTKVAAAMLLLLLSLLWFGFLALMLSKVQVQRKLQRLTPVIDTVIGVIFIAVAFAIVSNLLFSA